MKILNTYVITSETMALVPKFDHYGNLHTLVYETSETFIVKKSPTQIVKESCVFYGSGYSGRLEAAKRIFVNNKMLPIMISEILGIVFIPIHSPQNPKCIWIAYNHIKWLEKEQIKRTKVWMTNGRFIIIDMKVDWFKIKLSFAGHLKSTYYIQE
jgi:competence protein ComK